LTFAPHLKGGEDVAILNAIPDGQIEFKIPVVALRVSVRIKGETSTHQPVLDTVIVNSDERIVSLVWRCKQTCDKRMLQIELVTFEITQSDPTIGGL
jgi:hypothetical protein